MPTNWTRSTDREEDELEEELEDELEEELEDELEEKELELGKAEMELVVPDVPEGDMDIPFNIQGFGLNQPDRFPIWFSSRQSYCKEIPFLVQARCIAFEPIRSSELHSRSH